MKKAISLLVSLMFFASACATGKIKHSVDDITGTETVSMLLKHTSNERLTLLSSRCAGEFRYIGQTTPDKTRTVRIVVKINAVITADDLADNAVVRVNREVFELKLANLSSTNMTHTSGTATTTNYYEQRSDGFVDFSKPVKSKTDSDVQTTQWKELNAVLEVPPALMQAFLRSETITFRFYSGIKPLTYELNEREVAHVKEFMKSVK